MDGIAIYIYMYILFFEVVRYSMSVVHRGLVRSPGLQDGRF